MYINVSHIPPWGIVSSKVHSSKEFSSLKKIEHRSRLYQSSDVADSKCLIEDVFGGGFFLLSFLMHQVKLIEQWGISWWIARALQLTHNCLTSSFTTGRVGVCGKFLNGISLYQILQVSAYERSWINIPYYAFWASLIDMYLFLVQVLFHYVTTLSN